MSLTLGAGVRVSGEWAGGIQYLVNMITLHRLPVSCCIIIGMFSTSKSQNFNIDLFELSNLIMVRLSYEHDNSAIACIML